MVSCIALVALLVTASVASIAKVALFASVALVVVFASVALFACLLPFEISCLKVHIKKKQCALLHTVFGLFAYVEFSCLFALANHSTRLPNSTLLQAASSASIQ